MGKEPRPRAIAQQLESAFPRLRSSDYHIASPADVTYNCVAWAAGVSDAWWWPDPNHQYFWPEGAPRECTLSAFATAYQQLGYSPCDSAESESGYEKVAIFVKPDGSPAHAARQLPDGRWTSKVGRLHDIEHSLHAVSGQAYGSVALILKRPTETPTEPDGGI